MNFANIKSITIPEGKVKKIEYNNITLWKRPYKNWVKYSTTEDGVTIYNESLGYKNGYRVRSGGAEIAYSGSACTGYIPIPPSAVVRVYGTNAIFMNSNNSSQEINAYDNEFNCIGQLCSNSNYNIFNNAYSAYGNTSVVDKEDHFMWVAPPAEANIAYIRITGKTEDGSTLIVTINEKI